MSSENVCMKPKDSMADQPKELPLAAAAKRLRGRRPKRKDSSITELEQGIALGMSAVGVPQKKIAMALNTSPGAINDQLSRVRDVKETILALREKLKLTKIQKALYLEDRLWNMVDKMITDDNPKGVDGVMRAIHASEKIQQAVAGEGQKIDVTTNQPPAVDLKVLIQNLLQGPA